MPPCELPEDATVARAEMAVDTKSFFDRKPDRPYSQRDLSVLVISNTYDEIGEGQRHPDLVKRPIK